MLDLFEYIKQHENQKKAWENISRLITGRNPQPLTQDLKSKDVTVGVVEQHHGNYEEIGQGETDEAFVVLRLSGNGEQERFWYVYGTIDSYGSNQGFEGFYEVKLGKPVKFSWDRV